VRFIGLRSKGVGFSESTPLSWGVMVRGAFAGATSPAMDGFNCVQRRKAKRFGLWLFGARWTG
jgi:hypothetical protein